MILKCIGVYNCILVLVNYALLIINYQRIRYDQFPLLVYIILIQAVFAVVSIGLILKKRWGWWIVTLIYLFQIPIFSIKGKLVRLNITPVHFNFWIFKIGIDLISLALFIILLVQAKHVFGNTDSYDYLPTK